MVTLKQENSAPFRRELVIPAMDEILIKARRTKSNTTARKSVLE
jgi:hypothetical protein